MLPFFKVYELSKKLSHAIRHNKRLEDVDTAEVLSENARQEILTQLTDPEVKANLKVLGTIDTREGWEQVAARITAAEPKRSRRLSLANLSKVAALVLLFIAIGYVLFNDSTNNRILQEKPMPIIAGTDRAILTLEDGSEVILEKGKSYDNSGVKANGERLEYSKSKTGRTELVYNDVTVPRGGQYQILLSDSTTVWLNAETKIRYPRSFVEGEPRRVELVYGEAYFKVSASSKNQGSVFKVATNLQEVEVLGTEFNIKAYKDEQLIYTTLVEGSVKIAVADNKQLLIPNQQAIVNPSTKQMFKRTLNVDEDVAWINGYFNFKNKPLNQIMTVLSRWYDVDIEFETADLKSSQFSGLLNRNQNIEHILEGIKNAKFIHAYEIKNKHIIIIK